MNITEVRRKMPEIRRALEPLDRWAQQCHAASLELVRSEVLPGSRVARGSCPLVPGQHSWVVVGLYLP